MITLLLLGCGGPDPATVAPPAPPVAAPAKPEPETPLTAEQRRAYTAALDAARALHKKEDYTGAIAHFDTAIAIIPDDPRALSERGWAALFAERFDAAEADTRAAIARSADPSLLGSAWYNLGRIQEKQGRTSEAVASYERSLQIRPNRTVEERLASLAPSRVPAAPWTGTPMSGPWVDLEAWCRARIAAGGDAPVTCAPGSGELGEYSGPSEAAGAAPILGVRVVASARPLWADAPFGTGEVTYTLALRTERGWYTQDEVAATYNPGAFGIFESVATERLGIVSLSGSSGVEWRYGHARHDSDMGINEVESSEAAFLLVCGIGPSGTPSCVGPVAGPSRASRTLLVEPDAAPEVEHTLYEQAWPGDAVLLPGGEIELTGRRDPDEKPGTHALVFP